MVLCGPFCFGVGRFALAWAVLRWRGLGVGRFALVWTVLLWRGPFCFGVGRFALALAVLLLRWPVCVGVGLVVFAVRFSLSPCAFGDVLVVVCSVDTMGCIFGPCCVCSIILSRVAFVGCHPVS